MSKQYRNPISKPEMVTIPRWQYDAMMSSTVIMGLVDKIINSDKWYIVDDILKIVYAEDKEDGGE